MSDRAASRGISVAGANLRHRAALTGTMMSIPFKTKRLLKRLAIIERATGYWRHSRISYSQFGEDMHILAYYDRLRHDRGIKVDRGLFVDVGAFRPVMHSNSYAFYRQGWTCINIEPTPGARRLFDKVRPRDINLECAIGLDEGRKTFYQFGESSVWNTMDQDAAQHTRRATGIIPIETAVECHRLSTILNTYGGRAPFEVLSIDAEGFDIEIIKSNDFTKFRPRVILIESNEFSLDQAVDSEIIHDLHARGYKMISWINPNLMFVRQDSCLSSRFEGPA